jgi:hypothetical protein
MKPLHITSFFFALGLSVMLIGTTKAQTKIESKEDYKSIRTSINDVSQKLYVYAKQYPAYGFSAQYNDAGELTGMNVSGVADTADAEKISNYLLELEVLGAIVRNMDGSHLPEVKENGARTILSEVEAKNYTPSYDGEPMTSAK